MAASGVSHGRMPVRIGRMMPSARAGEFKNPDQSHQPCGKLWRPSHHRGKRRNRPRRLEESRVGEHGRQKYLRDPESNFEFHDTCSSCFGSVFPGAHRRIPTLQWKPGAELIAGPERARRHPEETGALSGGFAV
jgi:hypothetical protein